MKRLLLATTALVCATQAHAGPRSPANPPPAAPFSWSGCYVGAHAGAGWGHSTIVDPNPDFGGLFAPTGSGIDFDQGAGAMGGGQLGCDYQFANNWVVGAAGDFSFADIDGTTQDPYFAGKGGGPITLRERTEWLATATGRLGYTFDHWLLYGKGGAAWETDSYAINNLRDWGTPGTPCLGFVACSPTGKNQTVGWTAGFGLSYAFTQAWSAGMEYDHYDFGAHTVLLTDPNVPSGSPTAPVIASQRIEAVKFTLDYHFGR